MKFPRIVALLAPFLAASICHATDPVPAALLSKLKSLAGPTSVDCGSVPLHDHPDAAIACAKGAASAGKAYRFAVEFQGQDSIVWQGAARDEQGKLRALYFDSDSSGGSGAGATLSVVLCREIVFATQGDDIIACKPTIGEH